jgi:hypothetical protein
MIDQHNARVACVFPDAGPFAYVQKNFTWADVRELRAELPGILRDSRLWWDVATFHGYSWKAGDGIMLLNLQRKDEPGTNFFEMITMGSTGTYRARTSRWFRDRRLYKRTLYDEQRVESVHSASVAAGRA